LDSEHPHADWQLRAVSHRIFRKLKHLAFFFLFRLPVAMKPGQVINVISWRIFPNRVNEQLPCAYLISSIDFPL
jgi:hypothetical protein